MATQEAPGRTAVEDEGLAKQVQQQVQGKADDLKAQASGKLREQLDTRSTEAGDQFGSLAAALRKAARELESDGKGTPAGVARQAAGQVERLSGYLREGNTDAFLNDLERFARRRPWAAGGIGAVVGLAASRFLKASSGRRFSEAQSVHRDLDAPLSRSQHARAELPPAEGSPNEW